MAVRSDRMDMPLLRSWSFDVLVAGLATYTAVVLTAEALRIFTVPFPAAVWTLAVLHGAVLTVRRTRPGAVLLVVVGTSLAYAAFGLPVYFLGPAALIAVYTVAAHHARRRSLTGLAVAEAGLAVGAATGGVQWDSWLLYSLLLAAAWLLGAGLRRWQSLAREQAERADQLERAQDQLARLAVTQERVRIARELHDMVAHSMSVIAVQAATGRLVIDTEPDRARDALEAIEITTRNALNEMRQLLAVLRQDGDATETLHPTPDLTDLHGLVAGMVHAGLTVDVHLSGDQDRVPAGVSLACYRIIQEGLTNALKHAGRTQVSVTVTCGDDEVEIEVRDSGSAVRGDHRAGQGTIGMRERATLYGGTFAAGPHSDGGWAIRARLPYGLHGPAVSP